jgi:low affinity Fe/Cu permease
MKPSLEKFISKIIEWVGSFSSLVVHTFLFILFFALGMMGVSWNRLLLILTTVVSLEAIYLAIFIQMTVNHNTQSLEEVEENIVEIQDDIDEITEEGQISSEELAAITLEEIKTDLEKLLRDFDKFREQKNGTLKL